MNKVMIVGYLAQEPVIAATAGGITVATLRVAVNRRYSTKSGERITDFFTVVAWRQLGDLCGKYLAKGRRVAVIGELQNRTYDAKDGTKHYVTEIRADEIEFLTPREHRQEETDAQLLESDFEAIEDEDLPF